MFTTANTHNHLLPITMMYYTFLFSTAIVSLTAKTTDAFATSRSIPINRLYSSIAISAILDGITYESCQTYEDSTATEDVVLALYHDDSVKHSECHILNCILEVTGRDAADSYDAIYHSKGIAKVAELDVFPQEVGARYYKQLKAMGIPVKSC